MGSNSSPPASSELKPESSLLNIEWRKELGWFELGPLSAAGAELLLWRPESLRALGTQLCIVAEEAALVAHRDALRARFPHAILRAVAPVLDHGTFKLACRPNPQRAPSNFRTLPPWTTSAGSARLVNANSDSSTRRLGSGIPFAQAQVWTAYSRCGQCAGQDTHCIFAERSRLYSRRNSEYSNWEEVEYECRTCGQFTSYEAFFLSD